MFVTCDYNYSFTALKGFQYYVSMTHAFYQMSYNFMLASTNQQKHIIGIKSDGNELRVCGYLYKSYLEKSISYKNY